MFQPDEESHEECTVQRDFAQLLLTGFKHTPEGRMNLHTLVHMLGYLVVQLRQFVTAADASAMLTNMVASLEHQLEISGGMLEYEDGTEALNTPEWRAMVDREVAELDGIDTVPPEWFTMTDDDTEEE